MQRARRMRWIGGVTAMVTGALLIAGCQTDGVSNHEKWKQQADSRWHRMRSGVLLDMAREQFKTGDLERARESVRKGLSIDSDHAGLQLLAGRIALEKGKLERGFHLFNGAIRSDEKLARAHYYKGIVYQRWQQYDKARKSYKRAYDLKPDHVPYLLARSEMRVQQGKVDAAIELLDGKRTYFDQNSTLRAALGHLYNMKSRYDKAAVMFREASLLDPSNTKLKEELGLAQLAAGRAEKAIETFEQLFAKSSEPARADLRRALATAYLETGRSQAARRTYLELARSEAGEARDWLRLGQVAWQAGQITDALDAAHRAMDQAPQQPGAYMLAGMALNKQGKLNEALRMFDRAAELAPKDAKPLILRGLSLQREGRRAAAAEAYRRALERAPKDKRVKRLLETVDRAHS